MPQRAIIDYSRVKRLFDWLSSAIALIVLSPLFVVLALVVKLDSPGSALFSQMRVGQNGREFRVYKFRSMRASIAGQQGAAVTRKSDDRITRSGRLLRKWKLDELPQLWNVLRGDMSIVGPRPESPQLARRYCMRDYQILISAKPGITDLATLVFRNEEELLERSDGDESYYIRHIVSRKMRLVRIYVSNASFCLDLRIILMTLRRIILY